MVASTPRWSVDFDEYLRFEREAAERHELIDGEIVAMAGATRRHNVLCGRLHDAIRPPLGDGPCLLERSDQRLAVHTAAKGWVAYYPDLAVYCSEEVHRADSDSAPSSIPAARWWLSSTIASCSVLSSFAHSKCHPMRA